MSDRPFSLPLNCRADLDTAMPATDRPPGTLLEAKDCHYRYVGPKKGCQAFTCIGEGPGTSSFYNGITLNGVGSASATAVSYEDAFRDLGTTFTLDLWFRLEDLAYASAVNRIGLYEFAPNAGAIDVNIFGGAHTDHERIEVSITTSPTRTTSATPVTFKSTTRLTAGTAQTDKRHLRVVRNGANGYLYLDGVLDGTGTTSISATNPINGAYGSSATVVLGSSSISNITFKGGIYGALLRDGVYTTYPIEATMPLLSWSRGTHHHHLNHAYTLGSDDHYFDAGRFGVHARLHGTSGASYTVAGGADNTAPAPSPVQGLRTWTTRTNRTATSCLCGGLMSTAGVS